MLAVKLHLALAGVLSLHVVSLIWSITRHLWRAPQLRRLALLLGGVLTAQLVLGAGTWIVKFSTPDWAAPLLPFSRGVIVDGGWLQTHMITAHVALGSLLLATMVSLALISWRQLASARLETQQASVMRREVVV
jgi:cytochrome c oxidase assembly protein subunit 15